MRRCLILLGLTGVITLTLGLRELAAVFHGSELAWAAGIGVAAALFAAGLWLGSVTARNGGTGAFIFGLGLTGFLAPTAVIFPRLAALLRISADSPGAMLIAGLGLAPFVLSAAWTYAIAQGIQARLHGPARGAAWTLLFTALGGALGAALWALLPGIAAPFTAALMLGAFCCVTAFVVWLHSVNRRIWGIFLPPAAAALVVAAFLPMSRALDFLSLTPQFPEGTLRDVAETKYGRVELVEGATADLRFFGIPATPPQTQRLSEETALVLLSHSLPRRALLAGTGKNGIDCALKFPWLKVDYADIAPLPLRARLPFFFPDGVGTRFRFLGHADIRGIVRETKVPYEVIFVTIPPPGPASRRYATREFFECASKALTLDGIFGLRVELPPEASPSPDIASIDLALRSVFGSVILIPQDDHVLFLATSQGQKGFPWPQYWLVRRQTWNLQLGVDDRALADLWQPVRVAAWQGHLAQQRKQANTDLRPAFTGTRVSHWLPALAGMDFPSALLGVAVLAGSVCMMALFSRNPARAALGGVRMLSSMSMGGIFVLLLTVCQAVNGSLFGGFIMLFGSAAFGIAVGTWAARVFFCEPPDTRIIGVAMLGMAVLAAAVVPLGMLFTSASGWTVHLALPLFSLWAMAAGGLGGLCRTIAISTWVEDRAVPPALEAIGVAAGAAATGVLVIPLLGAPAGAWTLCALSLAAIAVMAIGMRRQGSGNSPLGT